MSDGRSVAHCTARFPVALWVPFNIRVREAVAGRRQAGGCVGLLSPVGRRRRAGSREHDYYDGNKEILGDIIRAWADANDYIVRNRAAAADALAEEPLPVHASVVRYRRSARRRRRCFTSREWRTALYVDGTVVKWLQQVSDFFMTDAGVTDAKPASEYFDPSALLVTIQ